MKYSVIITLAVLSGGARAVITSDDGKAVLTVYKDCRIKCPLREKTVCAIDMLTFNFRVYLNKCFYWVDNKCYRKLICGTRAELTHRDFQDAQYFHDSCQITCPMKEKRTCTIDLTTFKFRIFLNPCFLNGYNSCKRRQFYALKTNKWCERAKEYEKRQLAAEFP